MIKYFLATNATWNNFVQTQLAAGAQLGMDVLMGSAVNTWAQGKTWLAATSTLFPSGDKVATLFENDVDTRRVFYKAISGTTIPMISPGKFSVQLGAGLDMPAPLPFSVRDLIPVDSALEFHGNTYVINHWEATSDHLEAADFADGVLTSGVGVLSVADVASASSAAVGIAPVMGWLVGAGLSVLDADLTPWVTNSVGGASFGDAQVLVDQFRRMDTITEENMEVLASAKLHGVIDGAYTDNLGLAHAIAAGANEVVQLMQGNSSAPSFAMELLCHDGPQPTAPYAPRMPVFSTSVATVQAAWNSFQKLSLEPNLQFLKMVRVGTFTATTLESSDYGIAAGREVRIHVVEMGSDVTTGLLEDVHNYNILVQEVIQTISSSKNVDVVQGVLMPMFMGSVVLV